VLQKSGDAPQQEDAAEACHDAVEVGFGAAGFSLDEESFPRQSDSLSKVMRADHNTGRAAGGAGLGE